MSFREIEPKGLNVAIFAAFDDGWALVSAGTEERANTMTISWGALGTLWSTPTATVYIRQSRYTKEFVDANDCFTISYYGPESHQALAYLGSHSGRDEDKVAKVGLTQQMFAAADGTLAPAYAEAGLVLVCRKMYQVDMPVAGIVDRSVAERQYADVNDFHTQYVGFVEKAYLRDEE